MMDEAVMNMLKIDKIKDSIAEINIKESDKAIILNLVALNSSKSLGALKRKLKSKYEDAYNLLITLDEFSQEQVANVLKEMSEIPRGDILDFCKKLEIEHSLGNNMAVVKDTSTLAEFKNTFFSSLDRFKEHNCAFIDIDTDGATYKETELIDGYKLVEFNFVLYGLHLNNIKQISEVLDKQTKNINGALTSIVEGFTKKYKDNKEYKTAKKFAKEIYKDKCDDEHILKALGSLVESGLL